jgi:hypothetical protein
LKKPTYLPGSSNELTNPIRDVEKSLENQRPSEGSYDLVGQLVKSLDQTIYNANITTISDEYMAKVQFAKIIPFDDVPTVLPGHVYAHLYSKYSGGTHSPEKNLQVLEVWAGIDYCHTSVDSPDNLLETNDQGALPPEGSVDRVRMSALHKFYDIMVGSINIPQPGDIVSVKYTDSNPKTSGVIISHVGSTAATATSSPAGAHLSAGASATLASLGAVGRVGWDRKLPADLSPTHKRAGGYKRTALRKDIGKERYRALYEEVHKLGGIITSSGGFRKLGDPAANPNAAFFSHHKIGRAFDMTPYTCFVDDRDPYFAESAWGDKDKIRTSKQAWNIWCVSNNSSVPEVEITAWFVKHNGGKKIEFSSKKIKKRMFNFTALAKKYGFTGIYSRKYTMRGSDRAGLEWWHFQSNEGLETMKTTFLEEVLKLYSEEEIRKEVGNEGIDLFSRAFYKGSSWKVLKKKPTS